MSKSKQDDIFQAVLFADNFGKSIFGPECPLIQEGLIPLANRKLIDYALEALTVSGVQEIFIYCSNNGDAMKEHIRNSKWSDLPNTIHIICSDGAHSLGDALRDLDAKGMIRGDFILMGAGVVTNIAVKPWLDLLRETIKIDKGAVMTLIHRKVLPGHRSRPENENPVFVVDSRTGKLLAYSQKLTGKKLRMPLDSIQREMEVYSDTCDTGIVICSSSVLPLFTDNFDFSCMSDFIRGMLMNEEIMGNSIYLHRIEKGYVNRVVDFHTFHGISCDILQRWTYPVVPDMPFGSSPNENLHNMLSNFIYKAANVKTARDAKIGSSVLIGAESFIGKASTIANSIIGDKCRIGENVVVKASHIGNNVIIDDGCDIKHCIIMDGSKVSKSLQLEPRTLVIGDKRTRIEMPEGIDTDSEEEDELDSDEDVCRGFGSEDDDGGHQEKDFKRFSAEVVESLVRGFTDNVSTENLVLEIHGTRTANYIFFEDVTAGVGKGIFSVPAALHPEFHEKFSVKVQWEKTREVVVQFRELLSHYLKYDDGQKNLLTALEEYANDNVYFRPMLMQVMKYYYDEELLSEEAILAWHQNSSLYEAAKELRLMVAKFIDWLKEASEESESESDE